jgi:hypothetical protein
MTRRWAWALALLLSGCAASYEAAPGAVDLGVVYQHQVRAHWCWAAVDAMLLEHFDGGEVMQSDIVADVFGAPYDYSAGVGAGLRGLHDTFTKSRMDEAELWRALEAEHPIVLGYSDADSSHFRLVTGFDTYTFVVLDPATGVSRETYSELRENAGMVWDETHEISAQSHVP